MALNRFKIDGHGQLELNAVAFRRSGRIEAQCKIADGIEFIENGMLLAVDNVERVVNYVGETKLPIALHYSTEHMYDERANALKDFKLEANSFLPRMGYLGAGDKYTTNCLSYDPAEFNDDDALKAAVEDVKTTRLYAKACANGTHQITKSADDAVCLVLGATTMPDGQFAVKFQAL